MRLTLESTASEAQYSSKAIVEVPFDDVDLDELRRLFDQLLKGYGFILPFDDAD